MQKAMFLLESYQKGILPEIDAGYIFTINAPDRDDNERTLDPFRLEMMSYSGVRAIHQTEEGIEFHSAGRKILALIEPTHYPHSHVEPAFRSMRATEHIPFRFRECDTWMTADDKYRVLLPTSPVYYNDSFTVEFPRKGDVSILYFAFDENVREVVLPYVKDNVQKILKRVVALPTAEAQRISRAFVSNVSRFQLPLHGYNQM